WSLLGTREAQFTFSPEYVAVEGCHPLAPARCELEITYRGLDLWSDRVPVELRIFVDDVRRRVVTELLVETDLFKFVEQGIGLFQVAGIAELPDQVGRPQQQALFLGEVVIRRRRVGQPCIFDGTRNAC